MANLNVLRTYAQRADPATLPPTIRLAHSARTLTILDAYPKSAFHLLVLPRLPWGDARELDGLRALLAAGRARAAEVLGALREGAEEAAALVREEMRARYGCVWEVWVGFHAVPSMRHLHLHVLSADLCSPAMKVKKHYNSFRPGHGFFLPLADVLEWVEEGVDPGYYASVTALKPEPYERLLKEDLACWRCGEGFKNMPTLKAHLQEEFEKELKRKKRVGGGTKQTQKRKLVEEAGGLGDEDAPPPAKKRTESPRPQSPPAAEVEA